MRIHSEGNRFAQMASWLTRWQRKEWNELPYKRPQKKEEKK